MKDSEFLQFIHDRLMNVHGENELIDYMHRMRELIEKVKVLESAAKAIKQFDR